MSEKIVDFPGGRGGSGPDDPGLTSRVARLEEGQTRMEASLARIEAAQHRQEVDFARVEGRFAGMEKLVAAMPTTLQLLGLFLAVLVAAGVLQWFGPRLASLVPAPQQQFQGPR